MSGLPPAPERVASAHASRGVRLAALAALASLALFLVAITAACANYPGGSWTLPTGNGFSLLRNFWCDLLRSRAINGADNALGKQLASVAFAALGLGLWPFWWLAGARLAPRVRALVWRCGAASASALTALAFVPSDRFPLAHGVVALAGALLGMMAAGACVGARALGEPRLSLRRCSGVVLIVSALVHAALYVDVAYLRAPESALHPAVQKLATLALVLWMASSVVSARRAV